MRQHILRLGIGMPLPGRLLLGAVLGGFVVASLYFLVDGNLGYGVGGLLGAVLIGGRATPWLRTAAFLDGRRLTMRMAWRTFVHDLATADVRLDVRKSVYQQTVTGSGSHGRVTMSVDRPGADLPALFLRPAGGGAWNVLPLHNVMGRVLPPEQLLTIAEILQAHRAYDPATMETAGALRRLADSHHPYGPHQTDNVRG